jgi:hypothetical protein
MRRYFNGELAKRLCDKAHGAGLDTNPRIKNDFSMECTFIQWEFHLMDDRGFYDGYWEFSLKIPWNDPHGFALAGKRGNSRRKSTYGIKDYLCDRFAEIMDETLRESGVSWELKNERIYPGDPDYIPDLPFAREHGYHFGRAHYEYAGDCHGE